MTNRQYSDDPPAGLDPALARFIEELAREAVRRENRTGKATVGELPDVQSRFTRARPVANRSQKAGRDIMHRVQKYVEVGGGRIGYALNEAALSKASGGATWKLDHSFNVADAILDDPEFAAVLRRVLRDGHVIVSTSKRRE